MYHICLIPGLGVDERMFRFLNLDTRYSQNIIQWIPPTSPRETLPQYAQRLQVQIPPNRPLILIGVSFGGIMATELAKLLNPALTVVISSVKTYHELPWYYRLAGKLNLPRWLPLELGKNLTGLQNFIFGAKTPAEARFLHVAIQELNMPYVRWALNNIANWPNQTVVPRLLHLHGTHDKLFPVKLIRNFTPVPGGEHLMVLSMGEQISRVIIAALRKLPELSA